MLRSDAGHRERARAEIELGWGERVGGQGGEKEKALGEVAAPLLPPQALV